MWWCIARQSRMPTSSGSGWVAVAAAISARNGASRSAISASWSASTRNGNFAQPAAIRLATKAAGWRMITTTGMSKRALSHSAENSAIGSFITMRAPRRRMVSK